MAAQEKSREVKVGQAERLYKIKQQLDTGRCLGKAQLLSHLGVSPATLKRDIAHLRERMNAPVVWDREQTGWRLDAAAQLPGTQYELPGRLPTTSGVRGRAPAGRASRTISDAPLANWPLVTAAHQQRARHVRQAAARQAHVRRAFVAFLADVSVARAGCQLLDGIFSFSFCTKLQTCIE